MLAPTKARSWRVHASGVSRLSSWVEPPAKSEGDGAEVRVGAGDAGAVEEGVAVAVAEAADEEEAAADHGDADDPLGDRRGGAAARLGEVGAGHDVAGGGRFLALGELAGGALLVDLGLDDDGLGHAGDRLQLAIEGLRVVLGDGDVGDGDALVGVVPDLDRVGAGRELELVVAVEVALGDVLGALDGDGGADERGGVGGVEEATLDGACRSLDLDLGDLGLALEGLGILGEVLDAEAVVTGLFGGGGGLGRRGSRRGSRWRLGGRLGGGRLGGGRLGGRLGGGLAFGGAEIEGALVVAGAPGGAGGGGQGERESGQDRVDRWIHAAWRGASAAVLGHECVSFAAP